jgi:hypothetical protein
MNTDLIIVKSRGAVDILVAMLRWEDWKVVRLRRV